MQGRERRRLPRAGAGFRAASGFRLYNAILVVRWVALALASLGYAWNLREPQQHYGLFVPVAAGLIVYNLLLTLRPERGYLLLQETPLALAADYSVSFAAFALAGRVWNPFLIFCCGSFLLFGLRGTLRAGILGAAALGLAFVVALYGKGLTVPVLAETGELPLVLTYLFEFGIFSVVWSYSAGWLATLEDACRDVAVSSRELERANRELDERRELLMGVHFIRRAILGKFETAETLDIVLDTLDGLGIPGCTVWLLEAGALTPYPPREGVDALPSDSGTVLARTVLGRERMLVRAAEAAEAVPGIGAGEDVLVVPVPSDTEAFGALVASRDGKAGFTDADVGLLELFADQIALALQHVRLYEQAQEYAVAEEQNRISVEIHDTVVQKLYGACLLAGSLREADIPPEVASRLQLLEETILGGLTDLRFAVLNWDSLEWQSTPLELAERYTSEFSRLSGIPVTLSSSGEELPLAAPRLKDLLRVLQEALANAWRHAEAAEVEVALAFGEGGVELSITDDGKGFDTAAAEKGTGIGLRSIRKRGERNDGVVTLTSTPGAGTRVRLWLPC